MMNDHNNKNDSHISLSPHVRFGMEFTEHMRVESNNLYDEKFAERISQRISESEGKLQKLLKALARCDGILLIMLATKSQNFSFLGFPIISLSYAMEAVALAACYSFYFITMTFITSQSYNTLLRNWSNTQQNSDSDYIRASYMYEELFLKVFRSSSNLNKNVRSDFFIPRRKFSMFANAVTVMVILIILGFLGLHLTIQVYAWLTIMQNQFLGTLLTSVILIICGGVHLFAIATLILFNMSFSFDIAFNPFKKT